MINEIKHWLPISSDICHDNWPVVQFQLRPCEHFEKLVHRPRTTGQKHHCIAVDKH